MNESSFEYLYRKYLKLIVKFITVQYRIDVEASKDIAQEVFRLLWEKREEINDEDERRMFRWLCETAKRKSFAYNRTKNVVMSQIEWDPELIPNDGSAEYEDLIHIEGFGSIEEKYQSYLSEIKGKLTEKEREMFSLVIEKRLDAKEAAAELKITEVNFRVKWHRLRIKLEPIVKEIIKK